jgi:hypothetical protein
MGLTLLTHCSAPLTYWAEAFQTACYLINRLPTLVLNNNSPFQKLFNLRPNYSFMCIFGCACWPHLRPYNKHELDFRSDTCIFIGYNPSHHGYKCLHPITRCIYISRHVIFDESIFPFSTTSSSSSCPPPTSHTTLYPPFLDQLPTSTSMRRPDPSPGPSSQSLPTNPVLSPSCVQVPPTSSVVPLALSGPSTPSPQDLPLLKIYCLILLCMFLQNPRPTLL